MWGRWRAGGRYDADGGRWKYTHNEKSGDKETSAASLTLGELTRKAAGWGVVRAGDEACKVAAVTMI